MRWEDERYVRLYTRDTVDWHFLSFEAQGLFGLLMRKVDRAGILALGKHGKRGVAAALGHPSRVDAITGALDELIADGCVAIHGSELVIPNFIEAQEAKASDVARQREKREKDRAKTLAALREEPVTVRDEMSHDVTGRHAMSHDVTPSLAVPSLPSLPSRADEETKTQQHRAEFAVEAPTAPESTWNADDFWRWFQSKRQAAGFVAERRIHADRLRTWWSESLGALRGDIRRLKRAVYVFGDDPHWQREGLPWNAFMSQWNQFDAKEVGRASAG